ncbi:cyclin-domain-containing protein [Podospora appendiculata]|uniref:Cyclin-domain-containing protein n=1 Tax=Podospora appendiculata TaxID=314037 RepID=A0AAE0XCF7_9PEZI|nr:cyclin-domain-containing protein [Podospora appendiculata]
MATVVGDVFTDSSRFPHTMIGGPGLQRQHSHSHESHYQQQQQQQQQQSSSTTTTTPSATRSRTNTSINNSIATNPALSPRRQPAQSRRDWEDAAPTSDHPAEKEDHVPIRPTPTNSGASRFPSPPSSSSPSETPSAGARPQHAIAGHTTSAAYEPATGPSSASTSTVSSTTSTATVVVAPPGRTMPSPDSDSGPPWTTSADALPIHNVPASLGLDYRPESPEQTQTTIRVRDLAHIQTLARAELLTATGPGILNDPPLQQMKYEISAMPIGDIIEMVAALLTKITTTNDLQHDALNRNAAHVRQAQAQAKNEDGTAENMSPLSNSVLAFHGKNVPAITILSYLSRIHKYCPTTYEVFLSLLVYFDRMTERVNDMVMKSEEARRQQQAEQAQALQSGQVQTQPQTQGAGRFAPATDADTVMRDDDSDETDSDLADDDDDNDAQGRARRDSGGGPTIGGVPTVNTISTATTQATYFVVDSFNIHRLIIAGVTCASKFFSDVFYTNSRYAKVGGLPLPELNHLELQFLLLNDFRLAVPVEDLEAYATMLVEFYAREVISQRSRPVIGMD